jgi:ABC-type bacteriocin/lantibiotic exporter with double-glycine peptidase domain
MGSCISKGREHDKTCTRPFFVFLLLWMAMSFSTGCAEKHFAEIKPGIETRGHYIEKVPFYRQSESTCGPAALAGVFSFWGRPADLDRITAKIYIPKLGGTLPMDMENFAREAGFATASSEGTLRELKAYARKGIPVICMLDLGFGLYHQPHYITMVGFDDVNAVIIVHDGVTPDRLIGYDAFQKAWDRAGRWMLVIVP